MNPTSNLSQSPSDEIARKHHEQMLKLVAGSFYREMVNYGVAGPDVLSVAGHLLDNVMQSSGSRGAESESHNRLFVIGDVKDDWRKGRQLALGDVAISRLDQEAITRAVGWFRLPAIRDAFHPPFPDTESELTRYLRSKCRDYFAIHHRGVLAGLIGAENIDGESSKLEMRKLIGDPDMHGKGIGKRATFLFLYHTFLIRKFTKIYVHSMDTNIRNLNLNRKFGFELEGVFFQDVLVGTERRDVVRMSLLRSVWMEMFSVAGRGGE